MSDIDLEYQKRLAFRRQLKATLEVYRNPSASPPRLKEQLEALLREQSEKNERELAKIKMEQARLKAEEAQQKAIRLGKRNPTVRVAPPEAPRKINLEDEL